MKFYCAYQNKGMTMERCDSCRTVWFKQPPCDDFPRHLAEKYRITGENDLFAAMRAWYVLREKGSLAGSKEYSPYALPQSVPSQNTEDYKYKRSPQFENFLKAIRGGEIAIITLSLLKKQSGYIEPRDRPIYFLNAFQSDKFDFDKKYNGKFWGADVPMSGESLARYACDLVKRFEPFFKELFASNTGKFDIAEFGDDFRISLERVPKDLALSGRVIVESKVLDMIEKDANILVERLKKFCALDLLLYDSSKKDLMKSGVINAFDKAIAVEEEFWINERLKDNIVGVLRNLGTDSKVLMVCIGILGNANLFSACEHLGIPLLLINPLYIYTECGAEAFIKTVEYGLERTPSACWFDAHIEEENLSLFQQHTLVNVKIRPHKGGY